MNFEGLRSETGIDASDEDIAAAIERLRPKQRGVLFLVYEAGFPVGRVGEAFSVTQKWGYQLHHRAIEALRTSLS